MLNSKKWIAATLCAGALSLGPQPASASQDTAILMKILAQAIQTLLQLQELNTTTDEGFDKTQEKIMEAAERSTRAILNGQIDVYNREAQRDQEAMPFCPADQTLPTEIGKANTQTTYNRSIGSYNRHNSPQATRNPAKFTAEKNRRVDDVTSPSCNPRIPAEVSKNNVGSGSTQQECTPDQIDVMTDIIIGRDPVSMPTAQFKDKDTGEYIQKEIDTYNSRVALAESGFSSTVTEEQDALIASYEKLLASPTVDEINEMAGKGAVERSEFFNQQIQGQLQVQQLKETLQVKRLLSVIVAQGEERHREKIGELTRNAPKQ
ncbi:hypothetical protein [Pseudomonas aeruginosa]|uniref:hypothetical protein n=1 Tax=Pseudomonas aeruginosa TaxID=287 RepID=UPI00287F6BCB|nr:hypothetical protein [Pseudomonas aeruginosa]